MRWFKFFYFVIFSIIVFHKFVIVLSASSSLIEVVVLKAELAQIANSPHFSFCFCTKEEKIAEQIAANCHCHRDLIANLRGPTLTYPLSCLSKPNSAKCLVAVIYSQPSKYLYLRIGDGASAITDPEWQSIDSKMNHKKVAQLATQKSAKHIRLTYSVQNRVSLSKSLQLNSKSEKSASTEKESESNFEKVSARAQGLHTVRPSFPVATTRARRPGMPSSMATLAPMQPSPRQQFTRRTTMVTVRPAAPSAIMPPMAPEPISLIRQMGNDINQIRDFLLAVGKKQRIHPTAFDVSGFKNSVINIGNRYRRHHEAIDLTYNVECEISAKRWADSLASRRACLSHEPVHRYGENLFFFASPHFFTDPVTMAEATLHSFYMENVLYNYHNYNSRGFYHYGHFTQMLWRASRRVGVGVAIGRYSRQLSGSCMPRRDQGHFIFVVIKYDPVGNVQKAAEYFENVRPYR